MCGAERSRNDSAQSPHVEQEALARGDAGQRPAQLPRLAREHQRRQRAQLSEGRLYRGGIRPVGLLVRREGAPGVRSPLSLFCVLLVAALRQHPLDGLERLEACLLGDDDLVLEHVVPLLAQRRHALVERGELHVGADGLPATPG